MCTLASDLCPLEEKATDYFVPYWLFRMILIFAFEAESDVARFLKNGYVIMDNSINAYGNISNNNNGNNSNISNNNGNNSNNGNINNINKKPNFVLIEANKSAILPISAAAW